MMKVYVATGFDGGFLGVYATVDQLWKDLIRDYDEETTPEQIFFSMERRGFYSNDEVGVQVSKATIYDDE